jgi:hypothetical protein
MKDHLFCERILWTLSRCFGVSGLFHCSQGIDEYNNSIRNSILEEAE